MVPSRARVLSVVWLLVGLAVGVVLARSARAEEAFVLDNGAVLRGTLIREDDREVVFRLTGAGRENRVTVEKSRIMQRFVTVEPGAVRPQARPDAAAPERGEAREPVLAATSASAISIAPRPPLLPEEEPAAREEDFFRRSARLAIQAFPTSPGLRAALAALAVALLLALVEIGGRMVEIDGMSLGKSTTLALLLGILVSVDVVASDTLLLADRAPILILAELLAWVGCAAGILRCGIAMALQLLAFVVFSGAIVILTTGAVLVAI